ncbi:hypothetical protein [Nocardia crassostreae]|uniref:hypothetical protein n=1 Tax=Nocardia crassostreae TaxID=53428 RepID=UPI000834C56A|nr:hypothetical protein [Nocardia crassostreae]
MKSLASLLIQIAAITPVALAGAGALALSASAVPMDTITVNFQCQGTPPIGNPQNMTMTFTVTGDAPASANPGALVAITLTPAAGSVPATAGGYTINNVHDMRLMAPYPTNSTYVSAELSGGTVAATLDDSDGRIAVHVSDSIRGGSSFTLPSIIANVTAGASGAITTTLAGTSYAEPGLTLTANVRTPFGPLDIPVSCYPDPAPTFTTTTINAQD